MPQPVRHTASPRQRLLTPWPPVSHNTPCAPRRHVIEYLTLQQPAEQSTRGGRRGGGAAAGGGAGLLALQRSSAAQLASVATAHPNVTIMFADVSLQLCGMCGLRDASGTGSWRPNWQRGDCHVRRASYNNLVNLVLASAASINSLRGFVRCCRSWASPTCANKCRRWRS